MQCSTTQRRRQACPSPPPSWRSWLKGTFTDYKNKPTSLSSSERAGSESSSLLRQPIACVCVCVQLPDRPLCISICLVLALSGFLSAVCPTSPQHTAVPLALDPAPEQITRQITENESRKNCDRRNSLHVSPTRHGFTCQTSISLEVVSLHHKKFECTFNLRLNHRQSWYLSLGCNLKALTTHMLC